jgi:hypothetical protein
MARLDDVDIPRLCQLEAAHDWFQCGRIIGRGPQRTVTSRLTVAAYSHLANDDDTPVVRPGPWNVSYVLARGMAVQPLVLVAPDDDHYLPVSGNISDWTPACVPTGGALALPGMVCYSDRWHPKFTLAWIAYQVARLLAGEVLNLEANPLSRQGRDFQADALAQGRLPTDVVSAPRPALLYLDAAAAAAESDHREIEFHEMAD